ncbi:SIR2 family NAD-dependent protein deacylase [Haloechinothrix salitolerans]|uniref:protein acetyllysine N-acetyltransferase n=1 Tax=Haloechinothrix salitolerans TaxID=926830 RepID=A0ABW2BYN6_9PSEU
MDDMAHTDDPATVRTARSLVSDARRVVALTGAGVSTESGIPDFRGPDGVWTRDPDAQRLSNIHDYMADAELRRRSWQARLSHPGWQARPNAAHEALVTLERSGALRAIVTQNVDGLHQRAGNDPSAVIELHGTLFETACLTCDERREMREALDRVAAGEADPPCLVCGGILKSATISFGQALDAAVLSRARTEVEACDLLLAAGSSLSVHPAAGLVGLAARAGARVVICNATETPYDDVADVVLRGSLGEVLPAVV